MTIADTSNIIQLAPFVDYLYEVLPNNYNKALVAKLDYEHIVEVVGEEAVCQAEEGWKEFANTIVKYVDKIERKKNIKLVEEMK